MMTPKELKVKHVLIIHSQFVFFNVFFEIVFFF